MAMIPLALALVVALCGWALHVRHLNKEHAAIVDVLSGKHKADHAAWTKYTDALLAKSEHQRALLNQIADTWAESLDSACAMVSTPTDSATKLRRRTAQEAHKRAADTVIALGYGSPSSGVRVIEAVKEVRCG